MPNAFTNFFDSIFYGRRSKIMISKCLKIIVSDLRLRYEKNSKKENSEIFAMFAEMFHFVNGMDYRAKNSVRATYNYTFFNVCMKNGVRFTNFIIRRSTDLDDIYENFDSMLEIMLIFADFMADRTSKFKYRDLDKLVDMILVIYNKM